MAKRWAEVESSPEYQELSGQDKFLAKKQYWNEVVNSKQEYQLMPIEQQKEAKQEFFGGKLVEDMLPQEFQSPNIALATIGGTINTVGRSSGKLVYGIIQPVLHPVQTVKGISSLLKGTFEKMIPGEQPDEFYFDELAKSYKDRYGSVDAIADTVANDPFGFISDVYLVGGATSGVGKLSNVKIIQKATSLAETGKAVSGLSKSTFNVSRKAISNIPVVGQIAKPIEQKIFDSYTRAFGVKGKIIKDFKSIKEDTVAAVKAIEENFPEEGLIDPSTGEIFVNRPTNRYETLIAFDNAKKRIWAKATALSGEATDMGATIDIRKSIREAYKRTIKDMGVVATKTTKSAVVEKIKTEAQKIAGVGNISPRKAEAFMKSLTDDASRIDAAGIPTDYSVGSFYKNLRNVLRDNTDNIIEEKLQKAGYTHYRKQYSALKKQEKNIIDAAKKYLQHSGSQGMQGQLANFWSINELISFNPVGALRVKATSEFLKWAKSQDREIGSMFKNASKLTSDKVTHVFNPEILTRDLPISIRKLLPLKNKEISSPKEVLRIENKTKQIGYNPSAGGTRYGPVNPNEYTGGFGQFIVKDVVKKQRKIKRK